MTVKELIVALLEHSLEARVYVTATDTEPDEDVLVADADVVKITEGSSRWDGSVTIECDR